jgi:hypothetical protein
MAGSGDPLIGVGAALRKAREKRRLSLDEASRDTKLTVTHLQALEEEDFDALLGDPWVRGSLRTYAQYLGLSSEKVAAAYARHAEEPSPPPPPPKAGSAVRAIAATRIRDKQGVMVGLAVSIIVVAGIFGVMSRRHAAPLPASLDPPAGVSVSLPPIEAALTANRNATVTITADAGLPATYHLTTGEAQSFEAASELVIRIEPGGSVALTVDGEDLGSPGHPGRPWQHRFEAGLDTAGAVSTGP